MPVSGFFATAFKASLDLVAVLAFVLLGQIPAARAYQEARRGGDNLVEDVKKSIEKAIQYLKDQEKGKGNWEVDPTANLKQGGWSALAMLSLLNAGVKPEEPVIQRGLTWLRGLPTQETYVVGLQTMVFVQAGQPQDKALIQRNVEWF